MTNDTQFFYTKSANAQAEIIRADFSVIPSEGMLKPCVYLTIHARKGVTYKAIFHGTDEYCELVGQIQPLTLLAQINTLNAECDSIMNNVNNNEQNTSWYEDMTTKQLNIYHYLHVLAAFGENVIIRHHKVQDGWNIVYDLEN